jgi:hypothetical protein
MNTVAERRCAAIQYCHDHPVVGKIYGRPVVVNKAAVNDIFWSPVGGTRPGADLAWRPAGGQKTHFEIACCCAEVPREKRSTPNPLAPTTSELRVLQLRPSA